MMKKLVNFVKFSEYGELPSGLSAESFYSQISSIESELNHKLLKKIDDNNFVTDFGRAFLPYARKCISAFQEGMNVAGECNIYDSYNYLTLGISRDSASTWAMNCVRNFNKIHPGLRLSIIVDDRLTDGIIDKSTIIFWCFDHDLENYNKLWHIEYKYGLYASDEYLEKYGIPTLDNINQHRIIAYSGPDSNEITNWHLTGKFGLPKLTPTIFSQSRDLIVKMTADGVGIGAISDRQDVYYGYEHLNRVLKIVNGPILKSYFLARKGLTEQMRCNVDLLSNLFCSYFIKKGIDVHMA